MPKVYFREPAPWEQEAAVYSQIKMGKDLQTQTETISKATQKTISAQMTAAAGIIASQDRITEGVDRVGYAIENIKDGLNGLGAAFEWGISKVVWQLEQNRAVLRDIVQILSAPLDTQAKELKKRADEAYANEWFDDALTDYQASERKNKYDFTIHISMGMIYLFNIIDKEKALECFDKAAKYAKPKSNYYVSFALLHKSLCLRDMGRLEEALQRAQEAHEITKDMAEAYYQCAIYEALLGHSPKHISTNLGVALKYDKNYALKANKEQAFTSVRKEIDLCIKEAMNSNYNDVKKSLPKMIDSYDDLKAQFSEIEKALPMVSGQDLKQPKVITARINQLIKRNSFFDSVEAKQKLVELGERFNIIRSSLKEQLQQVIRSYSADLKREESFLVVKKAGKINQRKDVATFLIPASLFIAVITFIVGVFRGDSSIFYPLIIFGGPVASIVLKVIFSNQTTDNFKKTRKIIDIEKYIRIANGYLSNI
ncbi:MAG: hypothetical protein PF482_04770 [Desulfobacteraceae bacterium]|nr:hypothetical protein [Desulfobacteraceae bacterium]